MNIDITPRTHHDDDVSLALKIAVTSISGTGFGGLPTFGNREINTIIRLRDGETNMLAGLIRDDERDALDGIPGLSDLPLVGRLFAHNTKSTQQTDIILTLTPHIIRVLDLTEADLRPFRVGRDSLAPIAELPLPPRAAAVRRAAAEAPRTGRRRNAGRQSRSRSAPIADPDAASAPAAVGTLRRYVTFATLRAQRLQPLDQTAVAALHGLERRQPALPVRGERRGDQRHPRSQIAAVERPAAQLARSGDDDPVRIAEEQIGAHAAHLLEREQPQLVQPVVDERPAFGLRRQHGHQADQVARKPGPQAGRDPAGRLRLRLLDAEHVAVACAHSMFIRFSTAATTSMSSARAPRDLDLAAGDRGDDRPAARLDVVAPQPVLGAARASRRPRPESSTCRRR